MAEYYDKNGICIDHNSVLSERGWMCEGCGTQKDPTIHHMLIPDQKKNKRIIKELQYIFNLMVLCRHCHVDKRDYKGWDLKVIYWYIQVGRYGYDTMLKWFSSVPLITKPRYDLCTIEAAPIIIKPESLTNFEPSAVQSLLYLRGNAGTYK